MGGGAIRDPQTGKPITSRLPREVYVHVKKHVMSVLAAHGIVAETVLELPGKASFGDLDVLYVPPQENADGTSAVFDMKALTLTVLGVESHRHIAVNGTVMSVAVPLRRLLGPYLEAAEEGEQGASAEAERSAVASVSHFQVDFIRTSSLAHLETSRFYFSYSDVGSIIGRLVNHYALKFGDEGLWCELLEYTAFPGQPFDVRRNIGRLMLSRCAADICAFLGLDYAFWKCKIPLLTDADEAEEAIFKWLAASPYLEPSIFGHLNTDHRARAAKRPFYGRFVAFLGITHVSAVRAEDAETGGMQSSLQLAAVRHFAKELEMQAIIDTVLLRRARQAKFSGADVLEAAKRSSGGVEVRLSDRGGLIRGFQSWAVSLVASEPSSIGTPVAADPAVTFDSFLDRFSRDEVLELVERFVSENKKLNDTA